MNVFVSPVFNSMKKKYTINTERVARFAKGGELREKK